MSASLEESYFSWLASQVVDLRERNKSKTFWTLLRQLHHKEFVWLIPNDDNRVEDGKELRYEFLQGAHIPPAWVGLGCSFLELLIGLSRRLAFEAEGRPRDWFWEMLENLQLNEYTDNDYPPAEVVDEIMEMVIWRQYHPSGAGGIFPLRHPEGDQTKTELWYQLCYYVLERE